MRTPRLVFWPWLLVVTLAAAMLRCVWPDPAHLVPGPYGGVDAVFQTGLLAWTTHWWTSPSVWHLPPVFYPATGTLWLMDTLLGQGIMVTPLLWTGATPAQLYDTALLLSLLLGAVAAGMLWNASGGRTSGAGLMALAVLAAPYTTSQLGHLNQLPPPLVLFAAAAMIRGIRRRRRWWLAVAALLWAIQPAMGWYGLVNGALLLTGVLVALRPEFPELLQGRRGRRLLLVLAVALALVGWQARPYVAVGRGGVHQRSLREIRWYSADLQDLTNTGPYRAGPSDWLGRGSRDPERSRSADRHVLHPGWLVLLLAVVGLVRRGDLPRSRRRVGAGLLLAGTVGLVFAFGDSVGVPGTTWRVPLPWGWLWHLAPPLRAYRAVCRFAWPLTVALAWWAAVAWERLAFSLSRRHRAVAVLIALLLALEGVPMGIPAIRVPAFPVRKTLPPDRSQPLLSLPAAAGEEAEDITEASWWLVAQQLGRPVTGGVSGRVPEPVRRLRCALQQVGAEDEPSLAELMASLGIEEAVTPQPDTSPAARRWVQLLRKKHWPQRRAGAWLIWRPVPGGGGGALP